MNEYIKMLAGYGIDWTKTAIRKKERDIQTLREEIAALKSLSKQIPKAVALITAPVKFPKLTAKQLREIKKISRAQGGPVAVVAAPQK